VPARPSAHPGGHLVRWQGAGLEHQNAALGPLRVAELRKELFLDPGVGAQRPRSIAKYFPTWIAQPAYWEAMQLTAG